MKRLNLGCGFDVKKGWVNADNRPDVPSLDVYWHDFTGKVTSDWEEAFDFILINHVLCTMKPEEALEVLKNARKMLKPKGRVQVIDMDLTKAFLAYAHSYEDELPIAEGSIDHKLCMHISGYGTRLSHYTAPHLSERLLEAGYSLVRQLKESKYDTRPDESVIIEAIK